MVRQLGKYTLEKKIGSGGMADVWQAQGPNGVCVIKCPHPHLCGNPDFVRMFLDEASLLAQLHHPGIAQISDLGQVEGVYFLAMEYVPGFDLMTVSLEHERHGELMGPELCARIVADAAAALHYAHEARGQNGLPLKLVHRDVSPHNILLSRQGVVKLIDFGVAKAATTMHRTQAGFVKGKYPYMSPEQITGQVIDRRVDIYALGLVLYELLTNVRAIPGDTEIEQIDAARTGRIRPIEQLRPNVPVPLRQILGGCLHMDVEGRYPTALALKEDLEKYLTLERQVVGQEDLLRLCRVVAADVGEISAEARLTEQEQPVSGSGVVVLPENDKGKVDELVDAGAEIPGKLEAFVFPAVDVGEEDAGEQLVAEVIVDGKKRGRTPPQLKRQKGRLHVNAPPFCSLSVDGKRQPGGPVAVWNVELPEGKHSVQCMLEDPSLPRPRVKTQAVTISGGKDSNVEFNMATD